MLWAKFNSNGQYIGQATVGSEPFAGTDNFQIFAVFEGVNLSNYGSASIKFYKPDLNNSSVISLPMVKKTGVTAISFEGTTNDYFTQGESYSGFYFDFQDYVTDGTEEILDTSGLWRAVITLMSVRDLTLRNVVGSVTFSVGNGNESENSNDANIEALLNQIYNLVGTKLDIISPDYVKTVNEENIFSFLFEDAYNIGDIILNRYDHKLYVLDSNKEPVATGLQLKYVAILDELFFGDINNYVFRLFVDVNKDIHIESDNISVTFNEANGLLSVVSTSFKWNNEQIATEEFVEDRIVTVVDTTSAGLFSTTQLEKLKKVNAIIASVRSETVSEYIEDENKYFIKVGEDYSNDVLTQMRFERMNKPTVTPGDGSTTLQREYILVNVHTRAWVRRTDNNISFYSKNQTDTKFYNKNEIDTNIYTKIQANGIFASSIVMSDEGDYILQLLNNDGQVLASINLPLEQIIVDGTYDDTTEEIILTLDNGNTIRIPVHDLVEGLATTEDVENRCNKIIVMTNSPQTFAGNNLTYLLTPNVRILYNNVYYEKAYDDGTTIRFISVYETSDTSNGYQQLEQPIIVLNKNTGVAASGQLTKTFYNKAQTDAKFYNKTESNSLLALKADKTGPLPFLPVGDTNFVGDDIENNNLINKAFCIVHRGIYYLCCFYQHGLSGGGFDYTFEIEEIGGKSRFAFESLPGIDLSDKHWYDLISFTYQDNYALEKGILPEIDVTNITIQDLLDNYQVVNKLFIANNNGARYITGIDEVNNWYRVFIRYATYSDIRYATLNGNNLDFSTMSFSDLINLTTRDAPEMTSHKTITLSSNSTDTQYPSAKSVFDFVNSKLTSALFYQGSKTVAQLNALDKTVLKTGFFYNVTDDGVLTYNGTELEVMAGDNVCWIENSGWDKMTMDLSVYDDKFIAAGFFEVQNYNENTGEISLVYSSDLYDMTYNDNTGILTIDAN